MEKEIDSVRGKRNSLFLLVSLCMACSAPSSSVDPSANREESSPPDSPPATSPLVLSSVAIIPGYKPLILRRLSILLTQKLPTIDAISRYQADTDTFSALLRTALTQHAPGLAAEHRFVWNLLRVETPDLNRFALSDSTLAAQLTQELRWQITESPIQELRYLLEQGGRFDTFLSRSWTVESTNALSLWGETGTSTPWPTEAYQRADLSSTLGTTGVFASHSFAASLNSEQRPIPYGAFAETWRRILCQNFTVANTHDYSQIDKPLTQNWRSVATGNAACAGCHQQYQPAATTLSRAHTGTTLSDWIAVHDAAASAGTYAGTAYTDTASLMALLQQDPRPHLCELQNLISILLQKPFASTEQSLLARMGSLYFLNGNQLAVALQELMLSHAWNPYLQKNAAASSASADAAMPGLNASTPVVHILTRAQLAGILTQLSPALSGLFIPYEVNPGSDEYETQPHYTPSSTYFYHLDRTMRLAADSLIARELADSSTANSRTLFTKLPDGSGVTTDEAVITAQILQLWTQLTSRPLLATDAGYTQLKTLWNTGFSAKSATPDATREAWRLVLVGILLSHEFSTY